MLFRLKNFFSKKKSKQLLLLNPYEYDTSLNVSKLFYSLELLILLMLILLLLIKITKSLLKRFGRDKNAKVKIWND